MLYMLFQIRGDGYKGAYPPLFWCRKKCCAINKVDTKGVIVDTVV